MSGRHRGNVRKRWTRLHRFGGWVWSLPLEAILITCIVLMEVHIWIRPGVWTP